MAGKIRSTFLLLIVPFAVCWTAEHKSKREVQGGVPFKMVCYWDTSSVFRSGKGQFQASDIDPKLCTHLVLLSAKLNSDGFLVFSSGYDPDGLDEVFSLRKSNPSLKVLLGVEDLSEADRNYLQQDYQSFQKQLVEGIRSALQNTQFDGVDLDISKPDIHGATPNIRQRIPETIKAVRTALDQGDLLTVLASGDKVTADSAYDIPKINSLVDFINLKAFDYRGGSEKYAGLNAPMFPRPGKDGMADKELNADWTVRHWLGGGATEDKLVMGMASWGRTFTLKDPQLTGVGAPVLGYGKAGPYLKKAGIKGYNELCGPLANDGWLVDWEPHQESPFAYKDNQWIGYDDVGSIEIKSNYANEKVLAGAMLWTIDTDDFGADCGSDKFPLLDRIHHTLEAFGDRHYPEPEPGPEPYPEPGPFHPVCREPGYFANPIDCGQYYRCFVQGSQLTLNDFHCGPGTVFNELLSVCDWPYNVPGCEKYS